jgi:GTP-binding protein
MHAQFLTSAAGAGSFPADTGVEVAVAGRSNSGKSTAINRIVGRGKLARVSKTPGRTRLVNFFELGPGARLVDLPGYGFARVPAGMRDEWRRLMTAYFEGRRSLTGLILTVDIRRGLKDLDRQMIEWATGLGLEVLLLLTKADKLSRGAGRNCRLEVARELGPKAEILLFSGQDGTGVEAARERLLAWLGETPEAPGAQ